MPTDVDAVVAKVHAEFNAAHADAIRAVQKEKQDAPHIKERRRVNLLKWLVTDELHVSV